MVSKVLFSHKSDEWATPKALFDELNNELCDKYYTIHDDGLKHDWKGERVFCNPPYSKISDWCEKAFYESKNEGTLVVMLIPSRTDTKYFHDYIYNRTEIRFVKGRLKFGGGNSSAPFPSMIVIWRGAKI